MENRNSMRELIAYIANEAKQVAEVVQGTVTSSSPLKITLLNDAKVILTSTDLIVPQHLTVHTLSVNGDKVKIDNSLKSGNKVHLLSFNNGKKYFVLDKV
jgi:hypothetical protein